MLLHLRDRDFYHVDATTDPPVTSWEASFDDGATWHPADTTAGGYRWLVAGPLADPTGAAAIIADTTTPLLRLTDTPVVDHWPGPTITVWS